MEKVDKMESNIFLIKLIILISENLESKIEFGKKEGFKKLFGLLSQKDEKMSKLVFTALLHFLDLKNDKQYSKNTELLLDELDQLGSNKKEEIHNISSKLVNIAKELRKITFGEIDRLF